MRARHLPKRGRRRDRNANRIEVGMVKGVEVLAAHLQLEVFPEVHILDAGQVPVLKAWSKQRSNALRAEVADGASKRRG